jgi:hypothetical protein
MDVLEHQRQLLDHARQVYRDTPISDETARAYLATPRHRFVRRYREWTSPLWQDVTESNLDDHLATLYADHAIILFGDDDHNIQSTISQPSFVLRMLDLLQLQPGHTVLELGAGSGWNAAAPDDGRLAAGTLNDPENTVVGFSANTCVGLPGGSIASAARPMRTCSVPVAAA